LPTKAAAQDRSWSGPGAAPPPAAGGGSDWPDADGSDRSGCAEAAGAEAGADAGTGAGAAAGTEAGGGEADFAAAGAADSAGICRLAESESDPPGCGLLDSGPGGPGGLCGAGPDDPQPRTKTKTAIPHHAVTLSIAGAPKL